MATTKKTTKNAKVNKSANKSKKAKTRKQTPEVASRTTLVQKIRDMRASRSERKQEQLRQKQTEKARTEKAKQRAVREKALEQVNQAVIKSKRRRSHPFITFILIAAIAGLSGAAVWQYRDLEIADKELEITNLEDKTKVFEEESQAIEAAKQAEEDKFKEVSTETFTIRVPREWTKKPSQLPLEEFIIGDDNVTLRIVKSESRNSIGQFIPNVDYLWQISDASDTIQLTNQSLHCERFDRLNNDLTNTLREHNGFQVYCDEISEKVVIAALATPESYGTESSNTYFLIEVNDIQQVKLGDIVNYLTSFRSL